MNKAEAITLLAACAPLAHRLAAQGVDIELTEQDWAALAGFNKVWLADWLEESDVHRLAGLNRSDITAFSFMLAKEQAGKMRRERESGEQLD